MKRMERRLMKRSRKRSRNQPKPRSKNQAKGRSKNQAKGRSKNKPKGRSKNQAKGRSKSQAKPKKKPIKGKNQRWFAGSANSMRSVASLSLVTMSSVMLACTKLIQKMRFVLVAIINFAIL
jgi:hypothetical protein